MERIIIGSANVRLSEPLPEGVELFPAERLAELGNFVLRAEACGDERAAALVVAFLQQSNSHGAPSSSGAMSRGGE